MRRGREPRERSEAGGVNYNERHLHRSRVARRSSGSIKGGATTVEDERGPGLDFSMAPPWDSRSVSGAGVAHYHLLHRLCSVPTALGPAPLITVCHQLLLFSQLIRQLLVAGVAGGFQTLDLSTPFVFAIALIDFLFSFSIQIACFSLKVSSLIFILVCVCHHRMQDSECRSNGYN